MLHLYGGRFLKFMGDEPEGEGKMRSFLFAIVLLIEWLLTIPVIAGIIWLVIWCLKPIIWFLVSTMTLSTITRIDGWYAWYGYWDMLPWFTWNYILIATIISYGTSSAFEAIRKSTIFKKPSKTDTPTS